MKMNIEILYEPFEEKYYVIKKIRFNYQKVSKGFKTKKEALIFINNML